ncbi:MAG: hypothetical protein M1823_002739 [Watsoniomyces obsoletus]|nr:MAG: hypothetical protein M1823_002739 [Watsoniomyces obsoletus]
MSQPGCTLPWRVIVSAGSKVQDRRPHTDPEDSTSHFHRTPPSHLRAPRRITSNVLDPRTSSIRRVPPAPIGSSVVELPTSPPSPSPLPSVSSPTPTTTTPHPTSPCRPHHRRRPGKKRRIELRKRSTLTQTNAAEQNAARLRKEQMLREKKARKNRSQKLKRKAKRQNLLHLGPFKLKSPTISVAATAPLPDIGSSISICCWRWTAQCRAGGTRDQGGTYAALHQPAPPNLTGVRVPWHALQIPRAPEVQEEQEASVELTAEQEKEMEELNREIEEAMTKDMEEEQAWRDLEKTLEEVEEGGGPPTELPEEYTGPRSITTTTFNSKFLTTWVGGTARPSLRGGRDPDSRWRRSKMRMTE